jgi:protein gp37
MSDTSKIEWTDATWNPVTGCEKVSQGCKHCYAERLWPKLEGARVARAGGEPRPFTDVRMHPERLDWPLRRVRASRIFVNSMSDLFHESVPNQFIADIFAVMACTTRHSYQVLTKRPQRMLEWFRWLDIKKAPFEFPSALDPTKVWEQWTPAQGNRGGYDNCGPGWPLENVWIGVSVEDQATADERIPLLLETPAVVHWISAEPLLGPIDLSLFLDRGVNTALGNCNLNWVVTGGESGPKARPSHPDWFRSLRNQCATAGVPFFFKQWGEWVSVSEVEGPGAHHHFPDAATVRRTGKKLAGRMLDGVEHNEYPASPITTNY